MSAEVDELAQAKLRIQELEMQLSMSEELIEVTELR